MNAELPQTVLLKFIVMFVPCLTRPEGSGLLIHPPLTKRQNYKEEEFLRQLPSFYLQYENWGPVLSHNYKTSQFLLSASELLVSLQSFPDWEFW